MAIYKFLGRNNFGEKYYVSFDIQDISKPTETILHDTISHFQRVSLSGALVSKYGSLEYNRGIVSIGQNSHYLQEITEPAAEYSRASIKRLGELWDRWHLNDMNSHCAHQDSAIKWDQVDPCPITGYKAGHAWLLDPVPAQVIAEIRNILHPLKAAI